MTRGLHWFRNDLRLQGNSALAALADRAEEWLPVFVLDPRLRGDASGGGPRKRFLLDCLARLGRSLEKRGVPLLARTGRPEHVLPRLLHDTGARLLSFNEDTTPFARRRDEAVRQAVEKQGAEVLSRVHHVVFRAGDVRTASGGPYAVYSPYRKSWWKRWDQDPRRPVRMRRLPPPPPGFAADPVVDPREFGLESRGSEVPTGREEAARRRLERFLETAAGRYHEDRDRPEIDGTSRLSPYLRFGVLSVQRCLMLRNHV